MSGWAQRQAEEFEEDIGYLRSLIKSLNEEISSLRAEMRDMQDRHDREISSMERHINSLEHEMQYTQKDYSRDSY